MDREPKSLRPKTGSVNKTTANDDLCRLGELCAELSRARAPKKLLQTLAEFLADRLNANHVFFLVRAEEREKLVAVAAVGLDDDPYRAQKFAYARLLAHWVERTGLPLVVQDPKEDRRFQDPPPGFQQAVSEPLFTPEGPLGGVVLLFGSPGKTAGELGEESRRILETVTSVLALVQTRETYRKCNKKLSHRIKEHERELVITRRLASSAELITEMSRELRAPIANIAAVIGQLDNAMEPDDPRRSMLEVVTTEAARLNRVVGDQIELAQTPVVKLDLQDLNRILSECLLLVAGELKKRKVRVTKRLGTRLPFLLVEAELMQRVFLNMIRAGIESAAPGGRMKAQTKRTGNKVEVIIAADGVRAAGRALEELWKPFGTEEQEGDDVSIDSVQGILRENRGVVRVSSTPEWPLIFSLTFPISDNQDRRLGFIERRNRRDRRRRA